MLKGSIRLTLLMGPVVPVPVPADVVEALQSIRVTSSAGRASGFQLTFAVDKNSPVNTLVLMLGEVGPVIRTVIVVTVNGIPHVIMDGVIEHHEVSAASRNGQMTLTMSGSDLSAVMDLIDTTGIPYVAMPAEAQVALILAKYAMFGVIPIVVPRLFPDVPNPTERIPVHQNTDLKHMRRLAAEAGYVFYVEPGPVPGTSVGYWGPEIKIGIPQPALNTDMDAFTNVESLSFRFDGSQKTLPIVYIQNQQTRAPIPIPIPDISPLNPPLGLLSPSPSNIEVMRNTAYLNPIQAVMQGLARASQTSDVVTADGSLNVVRYGHVLKSRGLVGVRGAGRAFDGLYFVKSVTHDIKPGEYKQSFTLTRNGIISTLPVVPP